MMSSRTTKLYNNVMLIIPAELITLLRSNVRSNVINSAGIMSKLFQNNRTGV